MSEILIKSERFIGQHDRIVVWHDVYGCKLVDCVIYLFTEILL